MKRRSFITKTAQFGIVTGLSACSSVPDDIFASCEDTSNFNYQFEILENRLSFIKG
ncbi:MAG: hypothetical protein KTR26_08500 [Flammeovirgaceae bacterium]|nr:hypothetical protein [Flammeovirgaceae bacterium]